MRLLKMWFGTVAVVMSLGLVGCGDSGGSDDELSNDEAKAAAMESLAKVLNTVVTAVESVNTTVVDSGAMKVMVDTGMVKVPVNSLVSDATVAKYRAIADRSTQRIKAARSRIALHGGAEGDTHEDDDVDATELEEFLEFKSRSGNTITWGINHEAACDPMDTACEEEVEKVTFVQTISGDDSGTLAIKINDHTLIELGYASNSLYFQFDLEELKELLESEGETGFENVDHFEGQIRLTLTVLDDTDGQEAVSIALGIPEEIHIEGTDQGEEVSLEIAASPTVMGLAADAGEGTATLTLGLGTVDMLYVDATTLDLIASHIGGITGTFVIDPDGMVATNVGIGGEIYEDTDNDGSKEEQLLMTTFGFTVDTAAGTITLDSALDMTAADATGSLQVEAPSGTVITPYDGDITEVNSGGPVEFTGTGDQSGSYSATSGTCYLNDDAAVGFPVSSATCPVI